MPLKIRRNSTIFPNTIFLSHNLPVEPTAETVQDFQTLIAASSSGPMSPAISLYLLYFAR